LRGQGDYSQGAWWSRGDRFIWFYWESQNPWDGNESWWRERTPKKKSIVFKATPFIMEDNESLDEGEEEEFIMLVKKVGKIFYKKRKMSNFRRKRP